MNPITPDGDRSEPEVMHPMATAYLEHLRRLNRTEDTIELRRGLLARLDRELPYGIAEVGTEDLAAWLYRDQWSQNTRATYYRGIRSFFAWATAPGDPWLDLDPSAALENVTGLPGVARPCTDDQLRRMIAEAIEPFRVWFLLAAYQGLRAIEISRLDRQHVTERQLVVVRGKGNRPRTHDTDPAVWSALRDLPPGPVARQRHGARSTPHQVTARSAYYLHRTLGIDVTLHRLRHWLGCSVQAATGDIRVTQEILGHVSVASTQIYTQATAAQQRRARAAIPRLAG